MSGSFSESSPTISPVACDEIILEWTVHLAIRRPRKVIGIAAAAFLVAVAGYWMFDAALPVIAMLLMLVASISDFLFPTLYRLTGTGASANSIFSRTYIRWSSVRRTVAGAEGVKLSPFVKPSRLDAFRGVYLRYDDNKAQVLEAISSLRESSDD